MVKRPRKARLSVHLLWIVSSALVAGLLATDAAREAFAPDGRAKTNRSAAADERDPGDEEEQSQEDASELAGSSLTGPRLMDQLRQPFLENGSAAVRGLTSAAPKTFDGIHRSAWEELFERPAPRVDLREPESIAPPMKPRNPSALLAPAPTRMASATPLNKSDVMIMRDDNALAPSSSRLPAPMAAAVQRAPTPAPAAPKKIETKPIAPAKSVTTQATLPGHADPVVRQAHVLSAPPETMASQLIRAAVHSVARRPAASAPDENAAHLVARNPSEPATDDNVEQDSFRTSFQTNEPELIEPPSRTPARGKTVRQLVREIFTPAELPKSEAAKQEPAVDKQEPLPKLVREIFTPAVLPKSEVAKNEPLSKPKSSKAPAVVTRIEDDDGMPRLPDVAVDLSQTTATAPALQRLIAQTSEPPGTDARLRPASGGICLHCGRNGGLAPYDFLSSGRCTSCGQGGCVPGRKGCNTCESHTMLGGILCDLYDCICCPDPCYEPKWVPLADAAFFVDGARPVSQMRIGWDSARNLVFPDRSEFFWARADGKGLGPAPKGIGEKRVRYEEGTMYTETAVGGFSTFLEIPYRSMDPELGKHAAGFGDMIVGTKSLLFDCELLLITFQFKTFIPQGTASKGLGTGHATLEPSILFALKLSSDTYLQGQFAEWIPLGGNPDYAGSVFHSHFSLNHVLCRLMPDVPLIGTFEVNTWTFQDGSYTDPVGGAFQKSSGETYVTLGPGVRLFVCDRLDFGVGSAFAMTENHFAHTLARVVFRYRF